MSATPWQLLTNRLKDMPEKRILLMHISKVSGHRSAALAVEKAVNIIEPNTEVLNIDVFKYTNPVSTMIISSVYMQIIQRMPFIWSYLYDNPKVIKRTQRLKTAIHKLNAPKLKIILDELRPDCIACSQAYPCGIMSDLKKIYNLNIPLVAILTDYVPHSYWVYDNVDYYITPSQEIKERLIEKGVEPTRIKPLGIPIDPKFNAPFDREQLKIKLGLRLGCPIVLIMGGSHGLGPIRQVLGYLDDSVFDFQGIVVTGVNKKLFNYLRSRKNKIKKEIQIYGYADNINELMAVSDIIITKPGGVTISEALTLGLPVLILNPIPGQEDNNTQYLIKHGAAIKVDSAKGLTSVLEDLLTDPQELEKLSSAALKMSNPNASMDIARLLLGLCG